MTQTATAQGFRLSPQQRRLWLLQRSGELSYWSRCTVRLEGLLDRAALERRLGEVVARYEILRTAFPEVPGLSVPFQVIRDPEPLRLADRDSGGPFDLERGEALRATLAQLEPNVHELTLEAPALCADPSSLERLAIEMLGAGEADGETLQLADIAEWQNQLLESEDTARGVERWRELWRERGISVHLAKPLPFEERPLTPGPSPAGRGENLGKKKEQGVLYLHPEFPPSPPGRGAGGEGPFGPETLPISLPPDLAAVLAERSPAFFLACWQILLARSTGEAEALVGVLSSGRGYEELETAVGPFARYLPVLGRLDPEKPLTDAVVAAEEATADAERRQEHFSWEAVGHEAGFFPAVFEFEGEPWKGTAGGLRCDVVRREGLVERFKLGLAVARGRLALRYDWRLFSRRAVEILAERLAVLLRLAAEHPEAAVSDLDLLGPAERRQVLVDFAHGPAPGRGEACIHRLFEEQAARTPDRPAVAYGGISLTYRELNERANRLAHHLRALGTGLETPVALCLERSVDAVAAVLAVLKTGGYYIPLDPTHPADRLAFLLTDTGAPLLVTGGRHGGSLDAAARSCGVRTVHLDDDARAVAAQPASNLEGGALPASLAYAIYTSGSTGRPKGVLVEHRSPVCLLAGLEAAVFARHDRPEPLRASLNAPLIFDASVQQLVLLLAGHTLSIVPEAVRTDAEALLAFLRENRLDLFDCTPSQLRMLLTAGLLDGGPVPEIFLTAGEAIDEATWTILGRSPSAVFYDIYGPTECTVDATAHRIGPASGGPTIGRPLAGYEAYLLDRGSRPVPAGAPGELCIGGGGLARGYVGRPDLTAERFVPHPFSERTGARLYRTGDLARHRPSGDLEYLGRLDHQVKIRGFRIELGEIEAVLAAHPDVAGAAVATVATAAAGAVAEGSLLLAAYVVPGSAPLDLAGLQAFLRERLPAYMVPAVFTVLPALPLTPSGKVDRRALPAPDPRRPGLGAGFEPPSGPMEELLAAIWADVLGLERVGARDDFFELGGHSLLATQVISRVRGALHLDLPVRRLFEAPTVAGLAREIEAARAVGGVAQAPPLVPSPRYFELPASFAQQRLWFLHQLDPASAAYNLPLALRLGGRLDVGVLADAFTDLVRRHEPLRTVLEARADLGGVVQSILSAPPPPPPLPLVDLSGLASIRREAEARRLAAEEAMAPFDLSRPPVLRLRVLRLANEETAGHILLCTQHHVSGDGWSTGVLIRDVVELYAARLAGREPALPDLPVQYADYAVWQRGWLQGEALEAQLSYWRGQLAGAPAALELPTDRPRPLIQTTRGANLPAAVPAALAQAAEALGRRDGATAFMVLLSAFAAMLHRASGQDRVVVGTPIANRDRAEVENLIGLFANTLALPVGFEDGPSFRELVRQVREAALGAYAHQDVPFEQLVESLETRRDLSRSPLFQAMFLLHNAAQPGGAGGPGLRIDFLEPTGGTAKFDLTLGLSETADSVSGQLEYNADLFDAATADRLMRCFGSLLGEAVERPDEPVSRLSLLAAEERRQIVEEWSDGGLPAGAFRPVDELIAPLSAEPAVVAGGESLNFGELEERANRLARYLRRHGAGPEARVGICLDRSIDLVVAVLGVLKSGAAYVPLDPAHPAERRAFLVEDAGVSLLLDRERIERDAAEIAAESAAPVSSGALPESLAYVIYTSGSTGRPKGVMVTHGGLANYLLWAASAYAAPDAGGSLLHSSAGFDLTVTSLFVPLLSGQPVTVVPESEGIEALATVLAAPRERDLAFVKLTPSHARALESAGGVRSLILGGEALLAEDLGLWRERAPETVIWNEYGPTEAVVGCAVWAARAADLAAGPVPIGRPIAGARLFVLGPSLEPMPAGLPGELWIGGAGLARGYLGRPDQTAGRFRPDPFAGPGGRLYRTGDLARWRPDRNLEYLGRTDSQIKIRGYRIEPAEVEAALLRQPGVRRAAVVAREDVPGDRRLVAYLVPDTAKLETAELREALRRELPAYLVPLAFVLLAELPLTANGKLDRRALPAPDRPLSVDRVAPRTPVEELLAGIWEEVLRFEGVGVHDDFFDLGGHSLLATQVISRIRAQLGVELPLRRLFESPTIAGLAAAFEDARGAKLPAAPPVGKAPRDGDLPVSFAQQRLWFLHQLDPESPAYNLPQALRLVGRLDPVALTRALAEIVRRHETLRTTFAVRGGLPVQSIADPAPLSLPVVDLAGLPEKTREAEAWHLAAAEAATPFDLSRPPVVRLRLLRLGEIDHALLFTVHHVSADGWSMDVLSREIGQLYAAFAAGGPSPLPELPVQYADFAVWQRAWLQGEVLETQLSYWRERLAGAPELLELPTDRPRPPAPRHRGGSEVRLLTPDLARAVTALGRREGTTPFMTLLAAFAAVLHRYSGQDTVVAGSPIANRNRAETEDLIGFFVNTLALRVDFEGDPEFRSLLGQVRETALGAYAHQDLPFEKLVDELQPRRDRRHPPIFQVMLVFQNGQALTPSPSPRGRGGNSIALMPFGVGGANARFDLTLIATEQADGLACGCDYDADLFDPETVARFLRLFAHLLASAIAAPDTAVSALPLLDEEERRQVLFAWNDTARDLGDVDACLHQLFQRRAAAAPGSPALLFEGETVSYGELEERAESLAGSLRDLGIGPESRVAVCCERSPAALTAMLAVLKAGGAYVPLDPEAPRERLAAIAADAGAAVLLTQEALAPKLAGLAPQILAVDALPFVPSVPSVISIPRSANAAYIVYTSGSTGVPKGVVVSHRAVVNFVRGLSGALDLGPADRLLLFAPLSFDASVLQIFLALSNGAALAVHRDPRQLSGSEILALCESCGLTVLDLPAALWRQWVEEVSAARLPLPSSLRAFLTGGESVAPARLRNWAGLASRPVSFLSSYGPTEATVTTTIFQTDNERAAVFAGESVPIGKPLPNARAYVLDRRMRPLPRGVPGELFLGGAGLARGYLGRPDLTAEAFVPDAVSGERGGRLYRTGDLAHHLQNGDLEFLGRADHQVKIRGFRLELAEVEAALAGHPGIRECAAVVREDRPGDRRLVAYAVAQEDREPPTLSAMRAFLAERLPQYAVPSAFVLLPSIPVLASGKVDRAALPAPDLDRGDFGAAVGYVAPRTAVEKVLAGIWALVLGVDRAGVEDDFFELGGHSLSATQVIARIREELEVDLELRHVFESPTIVGLAAVLLADPERRDRVERTAALTVELAEMSDEEVEAMLLAETVSEETSPR